MRESTESNLAQRLVAAPDSMWKLWVTGLAFAFVVGGFQMKITLDQRSFQANQVSMQALMQTFQESLSTMNDRVIRVEYETDYTSRRVLEHQADDEKHVNSGPRLEGINESNQLRDRERAEMRESIEDLRRADEELRRLNTN